MHIRAALACAGLVALAACNAGAPGTTDTAPADMPAGGLASDIGEKQLPPGSGAEADADASPLAPSAAANTPCPDDGPRLPLSGVCRGRAINYMDLGETPLAPAAGCEWTVNEVRFGGDVMLYRGLNCGGKAVALEYAGGAHAAELSYTASVLHPGAVPDADDPMAHNPIVRVSTYWDNDDWRLTETIGSDAAIAQCEIRPAGAGYPEGARVIAPKAAGADCGAFALSDKTDNFWVVGKEWVFAFTLPKGARDIDPSSFTVVTPQ